MASAEARKTEPGTKDNGLSICEERYLAAWDQVLKEKVGPYDGAAGRNVVQDGVETKDGIRPSTEGECKEGLAGDGPNAQPAAGSGGLRGGIDDNVALVRTGADEFRRMSREHGGGSRQPNGCQPDERRSGLLSGDSEHRGGDGPRVCGCELAGLPRGYLRVPGQQRLGRIGSHALLT